jgi:hypothetical protein
MKRKTKIVVGAVLALPVVLVVGEIFLLWFMYNYGPEKKTPWVRSPDGQWSAQVRTRANPSANSSRLFLRHQGQEANEVLRVWGNKPTQQWSPKSRWIAGADEGLRGIWVYDVVSGHSADVWPNIEFSIDRPLPDRDPGLCRVLKWAWRGPECIVIYVEVVRLRDMKVLSSPHLAKYEVKDTGSALQVRGMRAQ